MTEESPLPPSGRKAKRGRKQKTKPQRGAPEVERLDSVAWNDSFLDEDPLALLADGEEGGFSMLEELDESECKFFGKNSEPETGGELSYSAKSEKRKWKGSDGSDAGEDDSSVIEEGSKEKVGKKSPKKKKKKVTKKEGKKEEEEGQYAVAKFEEAGQMDPAPVPTVGPDIINSPDDNNEELVIQDYEYCAWMSMKLHPSLMESIHRLGFKEPTPIQKACIPAAAHKGKDVIGAAETGSGKTLAFGLPILDCLLKERDKKGIAINEGIQRSPLRALIVTPTRELALQVTDHLKEVAKLTNIRVVPIVGGMSTEKQERLLKGRPEIIVGTPGRLWELMSGAEEHLVELHSLSFFVLDEADRMIEHGHFNELQSIIDMLPSNSSIVEPCSEDNCNPVPKALRKKRQTCVFSATIALSDGFRKKLKAGFSKTKSAATDGLSSIERLSEQAGIRADVAVVDLTNASIVADKLEESFIECSEKNKEAYLYYILSVHGHGRTMVFCTSIAALRRISSLLRTLHINVWTLHAQMQQRARLKALDRFRENEHGILAATDVAARGLDIPGVRTVIHYQLPHSAEVYIHRSGRTARASADGCCISLISPSDRAKFSSLCKSLSKENMQQFPVVDSYMTEVTKRVSLACQIDKILRKNSQENVNKSWLERNAESLELMLESSDSEEEKVQSHKQKKIISLNLMKLQQELNSYLAKPLQPKTFSHRFLAGAGLSPLIQRQLEELSKQEQANDVWSKEDKRAKLVVIGQDSIEPLQALRSSGHEVCVNADKKKGARRLAENWKRKRKEDKKCEREQRKKKRKAKEQVN